MRYFLIWILVRNNIREVAAKHTDTHLKIIRLTFEPKGFHMLILPFPFGIHSEHVCIKSVLLVEFNY